jgi:hypothetical protein
MTTRLNSISQQIEGLIADLNGYAPLVIPAIIKGGYTVRLNVDQAVQLTALVNSLAQLIDTQAAPSQTLSGLLDALTNLRSQVLNQQLEALNLIASGPPGGDSLAESLTAIANKLNEVKTAIDGIQSGGGLIAGVQSIQHIPMAAANTQYEATIPAGTARYSIECRDDVARGDATGAIRAAFTNNKVAPVGGGVGVDSYVLVNSEQVDTVDQFFAKDTQIYFAGEMPGMTVVLRRWQHETA